jgi:hypothetical protein
LARNKPPKGTPRLALAAETAGDARKVEPRSPRLDSPIIARERLKTPNLHQILALGMTRTARRLVSRTGRPGQQVAGRATAALRELSLSATSAAPCRPPSSIRTFAQLRGLRLMSTPRSRSGAIAILAESACARLKAAQRPNVDSRPVFRLDQHRGCGRNVVAVRVATHGLRACRSTTRRLPLYSPVGQSHASARLVRLAI